MFEQVSVISKSCVIIKVVVSLHLSLISLITFFLDILSKPDKGSSIIFIFDVLISPLIKTVTFCIPNDKLLPFTPALLKIPCSKPENTLIRSYFSKIFIISD